MSLRKLPEIRADFRLGATQFDLRPDALEKWRPEVKAATEGDASISVYDTIGDNWEGTGVTAKRIGAALRNIGPRDVTVNVNSPGGDFFEGVAIYNLLREHKGKVTVQVMGLAASAASIIAMAGDEIRMGEGSFIMIHNAWAIAIGNRHDLAEASERLAPFDEAMAEVYSKRAGLSKEDAAALMDKETWIGAAQAIEDGFADGMLESEAIDEHAKAETGKRAFAAIEAAMMKAGYTRSQRREAISNLFADKPGAVGNPASRALPENAKPSAGDDVAALQSAIAALKANH
jgi:ATP-dependent protease ClpP protease subunit